MNKIKTNKEKLVTDYLKLLDEVQGKLLEKPKKSSSATIKKLGSLVYIDCVPICAVCPHSCNPESLWPDCFLLGLAATNIRHFLHLYWLEDDHKEAKKQMAEQIPKIVLDLLEVKGQVVAQFGIKEI